MEKVKIALDKKEEKIAINKEIYIELFEKDLVNKLKRAEEQIRNGEVIDADIVLREMREKYEY
ncbi:MAG: hypothetical protein E7311_00845 [Clostridiales bacterium]|nr:hypothetical protein [Clostridiales bacterium]